MTRAAPTPQPDPPTGEQAVSEYGLWIKQKALHIHSLMPWADVEELIQWGVVALLEARERFDPSRGRPFAPFAKQRIRGEMLDSLRREGNQARRVARSPGVVADNTIGESSAYTNPLDALLQTVDEHLIAEAVAQLTERQQLVLSLFYVEELNNLEVAQVLEVSEAYVSQARKKALNRLRSTLESVYPSFSEGSEV